MSSVLHRYPNRQPRGFTLVEVALATAIIGIVLVALMGLLPSGASNFNKAMDTSITAQIAQRILHDAEQTEFDVLIDKANLPGDPKGGSNGPEYFTFRAPKVAKPEWRYFDAQGTEVIPTNSQLLDEKERRLVLYYVNVRIMPRAPMPSMHEGNSQTAQLTVQVARNPGHLELPIVGTNPADSNLPERNLIKTGVVPLSTFAAQIGKNQGR